MIDLEKINFFGFILMRISAFVIFNPILGRANLPALVKGVFIICITVFTYSYLPYTPIAVGSTPEYMMMLIKEALMGVAVGFIVNIFSSVVIGGCEIIDMQMGLGMAKTYDPQSNIQVGVTSSIYTALFMLIFFGMGCHINLIEIILKSYEIVPYGDIVFFTTDIADNILGLCIDSIELSIRFAMPILSMELLLEMGVGLLMKAVPQINVFVVNIQLKLVLGMLIMIAAMPVFSNFLSKLIDLMFGSITNILQIMT